MGGLSFTARQCRRPGIYCVDGPPNDAQNHSARWRRLLKRPAQSAGQDRQEMPLLHPTQSRAHLFLKHQKKKQVLARPFPLRTFSNKGRKALAAMKTGQSKREGGSQQHRVGQPWLWRGAPADRKKAGPQYEQVFIG